jgi:hypothetical protein
MRQRAVQKRLEKLERRAEQIAKARNKFSPDCICFPETEPPFFGLAIEQDIAFQVKCPLHGDRFKPGMHIYVAKWLREKQERLRQNRSARFQKAWAASFPPDLWPAEEEKTDTGTYLRLKGGSRLTVWEENQPTTPP